MIDKAWIGHTFEPLRVEVEPGRIRQFGKATGETRAHYLDVASAQDYGWPSLPVPPTMLFALEMEQPNPWICTDTLGIDLARVLHGEQEFTFYGMAFAGDTLTYEVSVEDIVSKRGGALELVTKASRVTNQRGVAIADLRTLLVVRNPEVER
jgi:acyl dehydratase